MAKNVGTHTLLFRQIQATVQSYHDRGGHASFIFPGSLQGLYNKDYEYPDRDYGNSLGFITRGRKCDPIAPVEN